MVFPSIANDSNYPTYYSVKGRNSWIRLSVQFGQPVLWKKPGRLNVLFILNV